MKDFRNWLDWLRRNNTEIDEQHALELYNEYYNCNCDACVRRKELGYMPVIGLSPLCKLDTSKELVYR